MQFAAAITSFLISLPPSSVQVRDGTINTPAPMAQPAYPDCEQFNMAVLGDTCDTMIARANNIDRAEFLRLNPSIGGEEGCAAGRIFAEEWYCFRARGAGSEMDDPSPAPELPVLPTATRRTPPEAVEPSSASTITPPPPAPSTCEWGGCWRAFADVSLSSSPDIQSWVTAECTRLFNMECRGNALSRWPPAVSQFCNGCELMSSACPCFLEGKYHANTASFERMTRGLDPAA